MGIKGLNVWIHATFPGAMQPVDERRGGVAYDHVLFDLNGIVHQACRRREREREVIKCVFAEVDTLLRCFPARKTVLLALDGPGPVAKLIEQRKRRIQKVAKAARPAAPGAGKRKKKRFDSLQVTPGTDFMLRLKRALHYYAVSRLVGVAGVFGRPRPAVFISGADVAGEGEIKLLGHLHARTSGVGSTAADGETTLLVGPDADLLLLGLAAGRRRCDVLTTDAEGGRQLLVAPLIK